MLLSVGALLLLSTSTRSVRPKEDWMPPFDEGIAYPPPPLAHQECCHYLCDINNIKYHCLVYAPPHPLGWLTVIVKGQMDHRHQSTGEDPPERVGIEAVPLMSLPGNTHTHHCQLAVSHRVLFGPSPGLHTNHRQAFCTRPVFYFVAFFPLRRRPAIDGAEQGRGGVRLP